MGVFASATRECLEFFPTGILTTAWGLSPAKSETRNQGLLGKVEKLSLFIFSCKMKWPKSEKKMDFGVR